VGVKPRIDTDIEFSFVHESLSGSKTFNQLDPSHVEAKAILLPKRSKKGAESFEDLDVEEYEFDIIYDQSKGVWVSSLRSGNYLINMRAKGFKELNQFVEIQ